MDEYREDLEFIPLYRLGNRVEAMFLKEVLDTEKVTSVFQNLQMSAFPTDVGDQGEIVVLVDQKDYARAKELIEEAIESKAISDNGSFETSGA